MKQAQQTFDDHPKSTKRNKSIHYIPMSFGMLNIRTGKPKAVSVKILFDSGATKTLVKESFCSKLRTKSKETTAWKTAAGTFHTTKTAKIQFALPEFHDTAVIEHKVYVAKDLGQYDIIVGGDVLKAIGMDIKYSNMTMSWSGIERPMKSIDAQLDVFGIEESASVKQATQRLTSILDAHYEAADLPTLVSKMQHLSEEEKHQLLTLLQRFEDLFDGTLGCWTGDPYNIELQPNAQPYHSRAYPIPKIHEKTLKKEVDRLCQIGVLKKVNRSAWAAPTFIIPKKNQTVRFVSDFRELNKRIVRKPYPIPQIQDLLLKLEGFKYGTSLDLNMGYYHLELTPDSKKLCTIVLPWGKYEYQRLPMGLCNSPDIFQEKMAELFSGFEFVRAYIDDLLCLTKDTWEDHLQKLEKVFLKIKAAGLKINAEKSFFGCAELEYLGYWITREGIQPLPKKIQAIQTLAPPTDKRSLRSFLGMINYYRDMWHKRSEILAPLSALSSKKVPWEWTDVHQKAFNDIKTVISKKHCWHIQIFQKHLKFIQMQVKYNLER